MSEENDTTPEEKVAPKKNFKPMAIIGTIGAVGVAIVALNTFTGLNFRPAWGYETEKLEAADAALGERIDAGDDQLAAEDTVIQQRLEKVLQIQDATSRSILQMNKGQYGLKLHQIDQRKRVLRRELAEHQSRAQVFRDREEAVPGWLRTTIADTETTIDELGNERSRVETQLLELEQ
jgi:hypothetical protein